jgi:hypothetical protein
MTETTVSRGLVVFAPDELRAAGLGFTADACDHIIHTTSFGPGLDATSPDYAPMNNDPAMFQQLADFANAAAAEYWPNLLPPDGAWRVTLNALRYSPGQHQHWHADHHPTSDPHRHYRISVVVQLSKPDDYRGGRLVFAPDGHRNSKGTVELGVARDVAPVDRGSVIVAPATAVHRVEPVTHGRRHSLVCFLGT